MVRLADYAITAVHYNSAGTHIESVKRSKLDNDNNMSDEKERTKKAIIEAIIGDKKLTYVTMSKKTSDTPRVRVVKAQGGYYLRSDSDETPKDNLGNLPKF